MEKQQFKKEVEHIKKTTGSVVVALQSAQSAYGCITPDAVKIIADVFEQSRCAIYSVATFYHQFSFTPKGKNVIAVCMGTACFVCGAENLLKAVEDELGIKAGEATKDGLFSIEHNTRCVGRCDLAPVVTFNEEMLGKITIDELINKIKDVKNKAGAV